MPRFPLERFIYQVKALKSWKIKKLEILMETKALNFDKAQHNCFIYILIIS